MIIGSIKEQNTEETRVSITPAVAEKLTMSGNSVLLEKDIGYRAGFRDKEYLDAGAEFFDSPETIYQKSTLILQILPPSTDLISILTKNQLIAANFRNFETPMTTVNTRLLRLELVPRLSVAQTIDILSAQNTVRGYMAALYALSTSPQIAPQLMTAAASIKAAAALVIGAGVTGLQAASVFKRIGCRVTVLDINEQGRELAKSVGADFIMAPTEQDLNNAINGKSFILAAAAAPNGNAPQIITKEQLSLLPTGAVIIDTTAQNIGIAEDTLNTDRFHFHRNLFFERLAPLTASELWANNMLNLINLIKTPQEEPDLTLNYISPMLYPPVTPLKQTSA